MTEKLYNVNDGIYGRAAGIYLDQEQQKEQARVNALREGKPVPNLDKIKAEDLPLYPGIVAVSAAELLAAHTSTRLAGDDKRIEKIDVQAPAIAARPTAKEQQEVTEKAEKEDTDAQIEKARQAEEETKTPENSSPDLNL